MHRAGGIALVAILIILTGCSGVFGGGGEPQETLTPASVPTDEPTPTPVPQLAPGLNQQGIENVSALVAAHNSVLRNQSFTTKSNTTELAPNGTIRFRSAGILHAGPPGKGVYSINKVERNRSGRAPNTQSYPVRSEAWANEEQVFLKQTLKNKTTTYDRQKTEARLRTTGSYLQDILKPFGVANTSVKTQKHNGTTLYLVEGSAQDPGIGSKSLRLLVDDQGIIHSYRIVQELSSGKNTPRIIDERKYLEIGSTDVPKRPSWVDEAIDRTTPIPEETSTPYR